MYLISSVYHWANLNLKPVLKKCIMSADEASVRFNEVSSQRDLKPSTVAATEAALGALKAMDWFVDAKAAAGGRLLRAMDFGCGTGLLTQKVADPDVFAAVVGVDVAQGMVDAFKGKVASSGRIESVKVAPLTVDLAQTDLG